MNGFLPSCISRSPSPSDEAPLTQSHVTVRLSRLRQAFAAVPLAMLEAVLRLRQRPSLVSPGTAADIMKTGFSRRRRLFDYALKHEAIAFLQPPSPSHHDGDSSSHFPQPRNMSSSRASMRFRLHECDIVTAPPALLLFLRRVRRSPRQRLRAAA